MILSESDLRAAVEKKDIAFDPPIEANQWGEASIDLRLGFQFTTFRRAEGVSLSVSEGLKAIGTLGLWDTKVLKEKDELGKREIYELAPGEFVLAMTHESITVPKNLIARVEGRSTYARMGLSMHQTAPWIQPGWSGKIVLEIANLGGFTIKLTPLIDRPCQVTFFELTTPVSDEIAYGSRPTDKYKDQQHPLVHKN
jgi:dCTP deaminase